MLKRLILIGVISFLIGGWMAYAEIRSDYLIETYPDGRSSAESHTCEVVFPEKEVQNLETDETRDDSVGDPAPGSDSLESLGIFKVTAYTAGPESTGKSPGDPLYGITATGVYVTENHTIASDWEFLPPGTRVMIDGLTHVYTVEDCGGAVKGKHLDLYIEDLEEALEWGVREREVWIIE